ncbi:MAG: FecR domain-containing protein [Pseudomonadota bacterium]
MSAEDQAKSHSGLQEEAIELLLSAESIDKAMAQAQLAAWEARSSAHRAAMVDAKALLSDLGSVSAVPMPLRERVTLTLTAYLASILDYPHRALLPVGTAAVLLLGASLLLQPIGQTNRISTPTETGAVSDQADSRLANQALVRSGRAEVQRHTLADGSSLWIGWNTRVEVQYTAAERRIILRNGRARFAVLKDESRPFRVSAAGIDTMALGTEFVVHKLDFETVEVGVREGQVAVKTSSVLGNKEASLVAQDVLRITGLRQQSKRRQSIEEIGAWVDDVLLFENRKLDEVLEALQPYLGYRIESARVIDVDRTVSGTFLTHRAEEALAVLMKTYQLEQRARGNGWVELQSIVFSRTP